MIILIVTEKTLGLILFALGNFKTPFGMGWFVSIIGSIPGLIVIDMFFGRMIIYILVFRRLARSAYGNSTIEDLILPFSLALSFLIINFVSNDSRNLLFFGDGLFSKIGFYQLLVSVLLALIFMAYREFRGAGAERIGS